MPLAVSLASRIEFNRKGRLIISQNLEIQVTVECSDIKETPISPFLRLKKHHGKDNVKITLGDK